MDKIIISDLEVFYCIGVPEEERAQPQRLLMTVEMEYDFSQAAAKDDLAETIDYHAVCQRLLHLGEWRRWKLMETVAAEIANLLLGEFKPLEVTVEIKKFIIPETRYVAVKVTRRAI